MKITDSQRELLRLVGIQGGNYWDVFNDWQARRRIPFWLWQPSVTFSKLERMGLVTLNDKNERLELTEAGKACIS